MVYIIISVSINFFLFYLHHFSFLSPIPNEHFLPRALIYQESDKGRTKYNHSIINKQI